MEIQVGQILLVVATAVFVGVRFLPSRLRQTVGIVLIVCYLIGVIAFMTYVLLF